MPNSVRMKLLQSLCVPRPIFLISSVSESGAVNLAPYSLSNLVSYHPTGIVVSSPMRHPDGRKKDTLLNVEQTKEWVVNFVTEELIEQAVSCSVNHAPDVSEFEVTGLTPVASDLVRAPRVAESPVNLEVRLMQIVPFGEPAQGEMMIGEIVRIHLRDDLYSEADGVIDPSALRIVARMGDGIYARTRDLFEVHAPGRRH
jgi:flavin reductase (DIM6/NTAB) family NADH-FMN oxidoreductase RutF